MAIGRSQHVELSEALEQIFSDLTDISVPDPVVRLVDARDLRPKLDRKWSGSRAF